MGTLRCDCYQDFAKQIEYPLIAWKALTGEIIIMNYEAKLIIGQKPEQLSVTMDMVADEKKFWSTLHDRKAIVEHHLILHTGHRDIPVAGLVNEFDIEGEIAYMLLFEQRTGFGQNSWLLERIIENSPVVALHVSFNGEDEIKLNYISKNIKRYGYTCEQFYSGQLQYKDIIHPDDFEIISEKFRAHINDGVFNDSMEYRIVTESRKISYVRSMVYFTRDEQGRINGMEALMLDIMDEKLNKDENQYLRSAIEQSHNVVIIKRYFNQKSVVKYVSSNAESLGMDVEGLRSGRKLFEDYILPEDQRILAEALVNVHKEKGKHVTGQCRIRNEEGQLRWISFEILVDNLDEYMYDIELILTDATGLKKYEQNLLQNQKDLEEKLADPQTTMLILCNPHNPIGKIWDCETLALIGELCVKHHVLVVSDEIHCDLTKPEKEYIPFASVSDICKFNSITCVAPTKAFNLAGIQTAAVIIPDDNIRHRVNRGLNTDEVAEPNAFAAIAPVAAFEYGSIWLNKLRNYLWENRMYVEDYIKTEIPDVSAVKAEATYLLWIDCRQVLGNSSELCRFLRKETGLYLSDGKEYRNGEGFLRMNLACQSEKVIDGMERLKQGIEKYKEFVNHRC